MKPLDPESRRLIDDVLAADQPAPGAAARSWSTLAERLHDPLSPTAAAAKASLEAGSGLAHGGGMLAHVAHVASAKLVVASVSAGVLCVAGAVWYAGQPTEAVPRPQPPAAAPMRPTPSPVPAQPSQQAEPTPAPSQPSAAGSTLSEEARLIAQAQRALNAGNPAKALALVEDHRRTFGQGALAQERDAARILALCALGRDREAKEAKKQFLRDWPGSALTARVRTACR